MKFNKLDYEKQVELVKKTAIEVYNYLNGRINQAIISKRLIIPEEGLCLYGMIENGEIKSVITMIDCIYFDIGEFIPFYTPTDGNVDWLVVKSDLVFSIATALARLDQNFDPSYYKHGNSDKVWLATVNYTMTWMDDNIIDVKNAIGDFYFQDTYNYLKESSNVFEEDEQIIFDYIGERVYCFMEIAFGINILSMMKRYKYFDINIIDGSCVNQLRDIPFEVLIKPIDPRNMSKLNKLIDMLNGLYGYRKWYGFIREEKNIVFRIDKAEVDELTFHSFGVYTTTIIENEDFKRVVP